MSPLNQTPLETLLSLLCAIGIWRHTYFRGFQYIPVLHTYVHDFLQATIWDHAHSSRE